MCAKNVMMSKLPISTNKQIISERIVESMLPYTKIDSETVWQNWTELSHLAFNFDPVGSPTNSSEQGPKFVNVALVQVRNSQLRSHHWL